ncbi:hypothetical protein J8J40_22475, partial [Mycobacterium tuberculosis]|nr:hypothetical protein [Mycobacterium tuberculosis]MBP0649815.1 hypothetical protein [Mycobacterium tuberculosis]
MSSDPFPRCLLGWCRTGEFRQRVASGVVLAAIAIAALWFGGIAFALLVAVGVALMLVEWRGIIGATKRPALVFV